MRYFPFAVFFVYLALAIGNAGAADNADYEIIDPELLKEEDEDEELEEEESARLQHQRREQHCPVRDTGTHRRHRLYAHLRVKSMVLFMTSISTLAVEELREMRKVRENERVHVCTSLHSISGCASPLTRGHS